MIAAGLGGRGASGHRGRSAFMDTELARAQANLLNLGGAVCTAHDADLHGRRLHFIESGAGSPLLLIHGAGGGAANWYRLIPDLSKSHRVIAVDLPGFGFSDAIDARAPMGRQVAERLAVWLRGLDITRVSVIGTSFGGLVALRLAEQLHLERIILIDSVGLSTDLPAALRLATLPLIATLVVSASRTGTRAMLRHALTSARLSQAHEDALTDYLYASARRTDRKRLALAFTQFAGLRGQREVLLTDELARLRGRLRVLWGEWDSLLRVSDVDRALALAGCEPARIIPAAGHSPNWENPEAVLAELRAFL
jgi:pimeloyl-ACP methyl ester carboxylesterase